MLLLLDFRSTVSNLEKQIVLLHEQMTLMDEVKPEANNSFSTYPKLEKIVNTLAQNSTNPKILIVIFSLIFVLIILFLSFPIMYVYRNFFSIYFKFLDSLPSYSFILYLLKNIIPDYENLKKKFEENAKKSTDGPFSTVKSQSFFRKFFTKKNECSTKGSIETIELSELEEQTASKSDTTIETIASEQLEKQSGTILNLTALKPDCAIESIELKELGKKTKKIPKSTASITNPAIMQEASKITVVPQIEYMQSRQRIVKESSKVNEKKQRATFMRRFFKSSKAPYPPIAILPVTISEPASPQIPKKIQVKADIHNVKADK